jgi:AcrR family transcriptional regulator
MTTALENLGRRERRKVETRQRLLDAGRALIAEGGTDAVRITDVADRADVGFGTFYTYFESKESLIEAVVSDVMARTAEIIGTRALESDDPAETAAISYRRFLAYATEAPEFAAVLLSLPAAETLFENALAPQARRTLERGVSEGRFDVADLELALTSVAAAALAAMRASLAGRLRPDAALHGTVMLLRSFGVPDAQAREIAARPLPEIRLGDAVNAERRAVGRPDPPA